MFKVPNINRNWHYWEKTRPCSASFIDIFLTLRSILCIVNRYMQQFRRVKSSAHLLKWQKKSQRERERERLYVLKFSDKYLRFNFRTKINDKKFCYCYSCSCNYLMAYQSSLLSFKWSKVEMRKKLRNIPSPSVAR